MAADDFYDVQPGIQFYRALATELRVEAARTAEPKMRAMMLEIAREYDLLIKPLSDGAG